MRKSEEEKALRKQIKEKRKENLKRVRGNLKIIGKNIGTIMGNVGKGMDKFVGQDQANNQERPKFKSVEEVMRDLPQ